MGSPLRGNAFAAVLAAQAGRMAWWILKDVVLIAIVIIYEHDFMLLGDEETVRMLAEAIQGTWKTSDLAFLRNQIVS